MRKSPGSEPYDQTSSGIGVLAKCSPGYVRDLALAGLVPHIRASNGLFLYPLSVVATVKKLKAAGLARRGISNAGIAAAAQRAATVAG
jgi:hypothetical protein